jgi:hypothetical protein
MNEHDALPTNKSPEQPPELPPIPDGGLAKAMPPWLAEPPTRPGKLAGDPTPLDLQSLAGSAELPQWLGDLSDRVDRDSGVTPPDEVIPIAEPPVAEQRPPAKETVDVQDASSVQAEDVVEAAAIVEPIAITSEPKPEPQSDFVPLPRPLPEASVEIAPEPRPRSTYLLYLLVVVVIAALAAWLILG